MKIFCIGRNYLEHALELNNAVPTKPVVFLKPASALAPNHSSIQYPEFTTNLQYECEIVLKVSKSGKNIAEHNAHEYFKEWTVGIDFTARDLQNELKEKGLPWEIAKAFDSSAIHGDFIPINEEKKYNTAFSLQQNEAQVQLGSTKDLIFSFEKVISYISRFFALETNDLIFTGTPKGVGKVFPEDKFIAYIETEKLLKFKIIKNI